MADPVARPTISPKRVLVAALVLLAIAYLADLGWYQCRTLFPKLGAPAGSVHRVRLLAIPSKGNKVEYEVDTERPEEDLPCSRSLFPQGGNRPCWHVARHANDPIPM